jgi:hypothetical protein
MNRSTLLDLLVDLIVLPLLATLTLAAGLYLALPGGVA